MTAGDLTARMADRDEARAGRNWLFVACFIALIATAAGFVIRSFIIGDLASKFLLSETQKGVILGVGLWPFAISIILFSLIVDKIGYGWAMAFAFACHVVSAILTATATGYDQLYWGQFVLALGNGTVEAVVNPVVASMYPKKKTKMLTILHAGWPGGIAVAGLMVLLMGAEGGTIFGYEAWKVKIMLILVPTAIYGLMMLRAKFPVSERVTAGVSYKETLQEAGALGWLIAIALIMSQLGQVLELNSYVVWGVVAVTTIGYLLYTRSIGRPMYIFFLLLMIPLAITELGTDTWIKDLLDAKMKRIGLLGGGVLVYTATIMMLLRLVIGPIVGKLRPLGVLLGGSIFAAAGLYFLSGAEGAWLILITATIYGIGQAYFWPVTLGVVAERFPRGGALTLNAIAGVGMIGVGILGTPLMGYFQDTKIESRLTGTEVAGLIEDEPQNLYFASYRKLDREKLKTMELREKLGKHQGAIKAAAAGEAAPAKPGEDELSADARARLIREAYRRLVLEKGEEGLKDEQARAKAVLAAGVVPAEAARAELEEQTTFVKEVAVDAKQSAMANIAVLPIIMGLCYIGLMIYFKVAHGGYKAVEITPTGEEAEHTPSPEEFVEDEAESPGE